MLTAFFCFTPETEQVQGLRGHWPPGQEHLPALCDLLLLRGPVPPHGHARAEEWGACCDGDTSSNPAQGGDAQGFQLPPRVGHRRHGRLPTLCNAVSNK